MKTFTKPVSILLILLSGLFGEYAFSQSVLNPADTIVTYKSGDPIPAQPAWGQIGKWIRTKRLSWNTDSYKCYIYKGVPFRLKFPKTYAHNVADGKVYPMIIMYHGRGEAGPYTDNEYQLYHGGQRHRDWVDNGSFDGYVLFMQSTGFWGTGHYDYIVQIINYMIANNKLDAFSISEHGLSGGAQAVWESTINYPQYIAASVPMSGISIGYKESPTVNKLKYNPIWNVSGAQDGSPAPSTCEQVRDAFLAAGGNYKGTIYPDLGHGVWDRAYGEADFLPFLKRAHKANPWPLTGRTEFCPSDPINVTLGVSPGFDAYEWRKDGVLISGATTNQITVNTIGTYECRVKLGTLWSPWSPTPVVIKIKAPTVPPTITVSGLMSKVIPAADGNDSVSLEVPDGYATYLWQKVGSSTTLSTTRKLAAKTPGDYKVRVTETFGCSSDFSAPFTVIDANGPNKPDAANGLIATTLSKTSVKLDWNDNPNPVINETGFEIYQGENAGGPYKLIAIVPADVLKDTINGLHSDTKYFYRIRAVNNTAAAALSNEASATTNADNTPPTAPANLVITGTTPSSIIISWTPSTDDVEVIKYFVYINGQKSYITTKTNFVVHNIEMDKTYTISVKAVDFAGNISPFSNQVSGQAGLSGFNYKYYTFSGQTWSKLPDFNTLTPVATGKMPNVAITPRTQDDNFAFLWEGFIRIPVTGTYYFNTRSDDGSMLYLGPLNGTTSPYSYTATPTVNNDNQHGAQDRNSVALNLTAGIYPIAVTFFEQGGGQEMSVKWRTPSTGTSYVAIPNSAFNDAPTANGTAPVSPSYLLANAVSYRQINLTWKDNSDNENAFEIYRSTNATTGFVTVALAPANATSYADTVLDAATTYYYRIRAIGQSGESAMVYNSATTNREARWKFNSNLNDSSGNGRTLSPNNNPTYDAAIKVEGTDAIRFNGTNQAVTMPTNGSFLQTAYTQKTIAFWMRSNNNDGNRVIVDIGGNDDGLALRLNNNRLYAGVASNNARESLYVDYTYANTWVHVALVYNADKLKLYLNGVEAGADNSLAFSSVGTTSNGSRIGGVNGSNAFNTGTGFFNGWIDDFCIFSQALPIEDIQDLVNTGVLKESYATTLALPDAPAAPTGLVASGTSSSTININWADNANNETGYELYRSSNVNTNYVLFATLPANTSSYKDSGLFANSVHYYKVRAIGEGGTSAYTIEDSGKVLNNIPAITKLIDRSARYGVTTTLNLSAVDNDGDPISFTINNKPAFAAFTDNGNKTATFSITPDASQQGVYNGIRIIAADTHGGADTTTFDLTVNDNYTPVIDTVIDYVVSEGNTLSIPLHATDGNAANTLSWTVNNVPDSFGVQPVSNGTANLVITPGYGTAGTYTVTAAVDDGNGGTADRKFKLTIEDKDPALKIFARFAHSGTVIAPFNNITSITTANLKDANGNTTGVGISLSPNWWYSTYFGGSTTGNNSGVYPDVVLTEYYYFGIFGGPETPTFTVTGLTPGNPYTLQIMASSTWNGASDNGHTVFTAGGKTVSLHVQNNTGNLATLSDLLPDASGNIVVTMSKGSDAIVGYINSIMITTPYNDGTAPAAPNMLAAENVSGQGIKLSWKDVAYNESGYEVHRATNEAGPFAPLDTVIAANATSFVDASVSGAVVYYYKLRAVNNNGASAFSDVVSITTLNRIPQITPITNLTLKDNETVTINVTAIDDATDNIRLSVTGLPAFASFADNGNGTGTINVVPQSGSAGVYPNVTVTATDNSDSSRSVAFDIAVVDRNVSSVFVNFSDGSSVGKKPWNNFSAWPSAGTSMSNLKDDGNLTTTTTITLMDNFDGIFTYGMRPGNGTNLFPDEVSKMSYFVNTNTTKRIKISGLSTSKKYNVLLYASQDFGIVSTANYTVNGQTITFDATYNVNKTVNFNGITPNASGEIIVSIARPSGSEAAFINAMVIQSYDPALDLLSPTDLRITDIAKKAIRLQWSDRAFAETGFQIYRAVEGSSNYTLLTTVGANVTNYTDSGLAQNKTYYYTVRAAKGTTYSSYTSPVGATTLGYNVYVNFTGIDIAPAPWNNTEATPETGHAWESFKDDNNSITSTGMEITKDFSEIQPLGMYTGNNSGVFPDNVLKKTYAVFPGVTGELKITGLNLTQKYNVTLFGSSAGWGDHTSAYYINGKRYVHNAALNIGKNLLIVYGLQPDENGEITVTVMRENGNSYGGYLCGIIVSGYIPSQSTAPALPAGSETTMSRKVAASTATLVEEVHMAGEYKVYPNPFAQHITVSVPALANDEVQVSIFNVSGQQVYVRKFTNLNKGNNILQITPTRDMSVPGAYIMRISFANRQEVKVFKVVKR